MISNQFIKNLVCLFLFGTLIISLQIENYFLVSLWALSCFLLYVKAGNPVKTFIFIQLLFGIGFFLYLYANSQLSASMMVEEVHLLLRRATLILILLPLAGFAIASNSPFIRYWRKPKWGEAIYFPFIWSGFHKTPVKVFLLIALSVNVAAFIPLLILNEGSLAKNVWLLAIFFSGTNAVLEELVWRGVLLSRFSELLGDKWAVALTSLGFGLQHYSLGFPWHACLAFSIGGLFFAGITIKSTSIFPAIMWHFVLNVMMVLSGMIM